MSGEGSAANAARLSFDALNADGSPRKFAGLWRPPFHEWLSENIMRYPLWYHQQNARDAWMRGDGDKPLYEEPEA